MFHALFGGQASTADMQWEGKDPEKIIPTFFRLTRSWPGSIVIKIAAGKEYEAITQTESLHKKLNPGVPLAYKFFDEAYAVLYQSEERIAKLSRYFAVIAIIISCLGLFGLAAFTAERRIKEIGVRKVLGASTFSVIHLISSDFTKMALMAIVIALPISYFVALQWVESFAYRVELTWWYFVLAGIIALLIAWITVSLQTVKAASINPVKCLKSE